MRRETAYARRRPELCLLLVSAMLTLACVCVSAATADASLGELSFLGCFGQLTGCEAVPVSFTGAVEVPKSLAVSPDGANLYAADQNEAASAIDVFSRNPTTGMLTPTSCLRRAARMHADDPGESH